MNGGSRARARCAVGYGRTTHEFLGPYCDGTDSCRRGLTRHERHVRPPSVPAWAQHVACSSAALAACSVAFTRLGHRWALGRFRPPRPPPHGHPPRLPPYSCRHDTAPRAAASLSTRCHCQGLLLLIASLLLPPRMGNDDWGLERVGADWGWGGWKAAVCGGWRRQGSGRCRLGLRRGQG